MIENFENALFFIMRFYFNCITQSKIKDGCENFKNFLIDERVTKKLKNFNVNFILNSFQ